MKKMLCLIGIHDKEPIGEAIYPYNPNLKLIAYGCRRCGKKLSKADLVKI